MNLPGAIAALGALRERLDAVEIAGSWDTEHGRVTVTLTEHGQRITVDGKRVPIGEPE